MPERKTMRATLRGREIDEGLARKKANRGDSIDYNYRFKIGIRRRRGDHRITTEGKRRPWAEGD